MLYQYTVFKMLKCKKKGVFVTSSLQYSIGIKKNFIHSFSLFFMIIIITILEFQFVDICSFPNSISNQFVSTFSISSEF